MTDGTTRVLAIPGSLRRGSHNRMLAEAASQLTPPGMSLEVYDGLDTVPLFNEDLEDPVPAGVSQLREAVSLSDGLLVATPEYNQAVPGVVKNMVDWLSRSDGPDGLAGKPVAVTGASTGPWGTRISQTMLRQMLTSTQALVLPQPTLFIANATGLFDSRGDLLDGETRRRFHELLISLHNWIRLVSAKP